MATHIEADIEKYVPENYQIFFPRGQIKGVYLVIFIESTFLCVVFFFIMH